MIKSIYFVLFFVVSSYSEPSFLDDLPKCSIKDSECLKQVSQIIKHNLADNGLPEMGISKLDPMPIINQTMSVTGLMDITMVDGYAEGMKACKLESFETDIEMRVTKIGIFCDVFTVQGAYSMKSAPLIEKIFGNPVVGDGIGGVVMEKLMMNFTNWFDIEKHDDGEIYLMPDFEKADYSYEMEKVTFKASNITLGILQIAPSVTSFMNRNWPVVLQSFGKLFSDKGMNLSYGHAKVFFNSVPAKKFISDDLSQYLKL